MLRHICILLILFSSLAVMPQDYSNQWEGHFSYLNIIDITQGDDKIFAATDNVIFTYDINTQELETITTVNGLSGENISVIHYSENFGLLIIGYENGLMEVVSNSTEEILTVIDILEKPTISPMDKRINHFNEYNDVIYIATDYGISVYNLSNLEFGDTYYIGNQGAQISINQTTIYNDYIYAAGETGVRKALVDSSNLIDYQEWQNVSTNNTSSIQVVADRLYAVRPNRNLFEVVNDTFVLVNTYDSNIVDVRSVEDKLLVTTISGTFLYEPNFIEISNVSVPDDLNVSFTSASYVSPNYIFAGTTANIGQGFTAKGVLGFDTTSLNTFQEIHPDGPLYNSPFSIEADSNSLWVTFGDYSFFYNPYPITRRGISHLVDESWLNIPFDSVLGATDLNKITINPNNRNQVFISSFIEGILELNDNVPTFLYDQTNSGLESLILPNNPNFINIRVGGSEFDSNGLLWSVTSLVENVLKSFDPESNQWRSYSFSEIFPDPFDTLGYGDLVIDNNGNKWTGSDVGLIGVKTNGSSAILKHIVGEENEGNLPSNYISALRIDNNNQLWIGTNRGLRALYNPESVFSESNPRVQEIIILDDGVPQELMYQQFVSDIEVDGSNNKWIGTFDTGLFYFSENGQETIYHFTKDNSPLPSNNIVDVSIDTSNGKVYIATDKGLVAFKSGGSKPKTSLDEAFVYPNPVRPTFNINEERVKIKDLSENVNIKITDIEGNLVAEAQSNTNLRYKGYNLEIDGGTAYWNGKNLVNNTVASGVYLILISDLDTLETKVLKLMIVR